MLEIEEMASEVYDAKDPKIENDYYDEHEQDKNDHADEYIFTFVNECNTNDEPVSKPKISYPTYDLPEDLMATEIQKMRAQENEKEKISDDLRNCVDRKGKADAVASSDVKMIEEPQPQQEKIQSENGNRKCARSDGTEFEETSQEMDAWTTGIWVRFPSLTEHSLAFEDTSMEMNNICASEIKINSETLTAFTCSAVYDMATSTALPPASSPSPDDGGTPTPIVQECTTIPVLPQVPPATDATTLPLSIPSDVCRRRS